ncbi:uncharacterized protein A1O9_09380 [Exophiala aquamarina CBS 119918]|uniref:Major facilitator superfamily (MFS) profile domain-containing protein n=1 Tax=Exophiala aquamarina CBS 119918 TaxID=1182545 RepID=A0A072P5D3_9EURO|nr:uncharacterized protein A1O9_09380 [Exophiala aquamarina CBS 119918]KEF54937.1 hypothetical protein A1O9_09380 [Exophiala aquamarina CBS 119918]
MDKMASSKAETFEDLSQAPAESFEEIEEVHIHAKTIIASVAICFMQFALVSATVGSGALGAVSTGLFGDSSKGPWLNTIILLFGVAGNPLFGQSVDLWGRKWIIVGTSFMGIIGSIIVSCAQNLATLIAGFCVIGISFTSQFCLLAIASEILPRSHRGVGQVALSASTGFALISGALACGALTRGGHADNYRIFFYYVAALYVVATLGLAFGYTPPARELQQTLTTRQKVQRLDGVGMFLVSIGATLFCVGLQFSSTSGSWQDGRVLGPFVAGVTLMTVFGIYEWRFKKDGILHHDLFRHRNFALCVIIVGLEGLSFYTTNVFLILESTIVEGTDIFQASLRLAIPCSVASVVLLGIALLLTRFRRIREPLVFGFALLTISPGLMSTITSSSGAGAFIGYPTLGVVGLQFALASVAVGAQFATPPDMIAVTSAVFAAGRSLGGAIGIAVNSALLSNALSSELPKKIAAEVLPLGLEAASLPALISALMANDQQALAAVPGISPTIISAAAQGIKSGYAASFRPAWIASAAFAAAGTIICMFVTNPMKEFTPHIDAPVEAELIELQEKKEALERRRQNC